MIEKNDNIAKIGLYNSAAGASYQYSSDNESWYDSYYAIKETFSVEEIKSMSEKEVDNLVHLANNIADALY